MWTCPECERESEFQTAAWAASYAHEDGCSYDPVEEYPPGFDDEYERWADR